MSESIREAVEALTLDAVDETLLDALRADRHVEHMYRESETRNALSATRASLTSLVAILERNGGHLWHDELEALWRAKELLKENYNPVVSCR